MDGNLCIATHARMWYVYIYVLYHHNPGLHRRFYGLDLKRKWSYLKTYHRLIARFINNEENGCRFEGQRKETWIYTRPAWLIAVRERMLEFYSDGTTQFINTLALDVIHVLDSRNYFQACYGKYSSMHVCSRSLSFRQRVGCWIV